MKTARSSRSGGLTATHAELLQILSAGCDGITDLSPGDPSCPQLTPPEDMPFEEFIRRSLDETAESLQGASMAWDHHFLSSNQDLYSQENFERHRQLFHDNVTNHNSSRDPPAGQLTDSEMDFLSNDSRPSTSNRSYEMNDFAGDFSRWKRPQLVKIKSTTTEKPIEVKMPNYRQQNADLLKICFLSTRLPEGSSLETRIAEAAAARARMAEDEFLLMNHASTSRSAQASTSRTLDEASATEAYSSKTLDEASASKSTEASSSRSAEAYSSKLGEASSSRLAEAYSSKSGEAYSSKLGEASSSRRLGEVSSSRTGQASSSRSAEAYSSKSGEAYSSRRPNEASSSRSAEASSSRSVEASSSKLGEASSSRLAEASSSRSAEAYSAATASSNLGDLDPSSWWCGARSPEVPPRPRSPDQLLSDELRRSLRAGRFELKSSAVSPSSFQRGSDDQITIESDSVVKLMVRNIDNRNYSLNERVSKKTALNIGQQPKFEIGKIHTTEISKQGGLCQRFRGIECSAEEFSKASDDTAAFGIHALSVKQHSMSHELSHPQWRADFYRLIADGLKVSIGANKFRELKDLDRFLSIWQLHIAVDILETFYIVEKEKRLEALRKIQKLALHEPSASVREDYCGSVWSFYTEDVDGRHELPESIKEVWKKVLDDSIKAAIDSGNGALIETQFIPYIASVLPYFINQGEQDKLFQKIIKYSSADRKESTNSRKNSIAAISVESGEIHDLDLFWLFMTRACISHNRQLRSGMTGQEAFFALMKSAKSKIITSSTA